MRRIAAVSVNHNTSLYTELMLRSLFATHRSFRRPWPAVAGHVFANCHDFYGHDRRHHDSQRDVLRRQSRERDRIRGATRSTGALR